MDRLWPHSPAPLVAVGGGIAASWFFGLDALGVSSVGLIPQGLPSLTLPDLALVQQLIPGALGIALMSFTETIAAGRAFADRNDPTIDAGRELIATGAANLGGALFGAMPAGGGTSQTAVVRAAGGRSQKASLTTAATAALTMLLLAPLLGLMPHATLAAVVIVYSVGLIQPAEFGAIRRVRTMEFRWALVACLGVLVFGTLKGIVVAIIVSLIGLASQTARPPVYAIGRKRGADVLRPLSPEHPDDETFEGLLIARPEGRLFFVNAQSVADELGALVARYQPRVVALDLSRVPDIEFSALQMLMEGELRAPARGFELWLVGLNPGVLEVVRRSGLAERLGPRAPVVQRARGDRTLPGTRRDAAGPAQLRRMGVDDPSHRLPPQHGLPSGRAAVIACARFAERSPLVPNRRDLPPRHRTRFRPGRPGWGGACSLGPGEGRCARKAGEPGRQRPLHHLLQAARAGHSGAARAPTTEAQADDAAHPGGGPRARCRAREGQGPRGDDPHLREPDGAGARCARRHSARLHHEGRAGCVGQGAGLLNQIAPYYDPDAVPLQPVTR